MSSSTRGFSFSNSKSDSPPPKRALIPTPATEPLTRLEHYFKSKTEEVVFYHQWSIDNFSYYCLGDDDESNASPVLCSSVFSSPWNEKLQFRLELHPTGCDGEDKGHVSLFLSLWNCDRESICLTYRCWLWDWYGMYSKAFEYKLKFIASESKCYGKGQFCPIADIMNPAYKLAPGDMITICCGICYQETVPEDWYGDTMAVNYLKSDCSRLRLNEKLSDVVLVFGDGEQKREFRAHKAILGACSEVFAAMFEHEMREKKDNRVEITDVDAEVGEEILDYLYEKRYPNFVIYADKMLPFADKYQVHSLKAICEGVLCFRINSEFVGNLLLLADMHNAELLKLKCIQYIHSHASCVVESESIKDLMHTRPDLYFELFNYIPKESPFVSWSPPSVSADPFFRSWSYTFSSVSKCSKLWIIGQFEANNLSGCACQHDFIETKPFPYKPYDNSSVQFSVKLYPHGEKDDCKDYLSLYLQLKCYDELKVAVKVRVSIVVDENNAKGYTLEIKKKVSNGASFGWTKFIAQKELMDNNKLFLNGSSDQLILLCEVFYIENIDEPETESGLNSFTKQHEFSIARDLSKLYESQKLTDAVFVLGHKEINVHKSIVSARSEVFASLFENTNLVLIDDVDIDVEAFEHMIALVYGQTEVLTEWAHKMLPLLDKFGLDSLNQVCQLALCDRLNDDNVAHFVLFADTIEANLLKIKALEYIRRKHSVLTKNDAIKVIQEKNPKLFYELLCYKLENWKNPNLDDK